MLAGWLGGWVGARWEHSLQTVKCWAGTRGGDHEAFSASVYLGAGSTSEKRSPVKRERSCSHDSASSSLSSKASGKSPGGRVACWDVSF